jgi:hypothetical protein
VRELVGDVLLQEVADLGGVPVAVAEELLEGTDGDAGVEGQGRAGLARQIGEQAAAVELEQVEGLGVAATEQELLQVVGESRAEGLDLVSSHRTPPG